MLRSVAGFPPGSEIVLTFALPHGDAPSGFAERAEGFGEPWVSRFEPEAIEAKLRAAGFSRVEFLSPAGAEALYFGQGAGGLPVPKRTNILFAVR